MVERRAPAHVMRLSRLGSLHQSRLSFMRQLTRRMAADEWNFEKRAFDINETGVGHAVYSAVGPERTYSLVAFAHDLPDDQRSDRVIAEAWDVTMTLHDGVPSDDDIKRLKENVPLQEAGRVSEKEVSLSRANRSVRLWNHVVDALAQGVQPDVAQIRDVGYLMRTTAVYGSGKFGAADRETLADRAEFQAPFQAEMLSVYLTRWFVRDLVQHMACVKGGADAVALDPNLARQLGIGNSTGLGMAPFLINHPVLFNNWIMAREEAIARVRSLVAVKANEVDTFLSLFQRATQSVAAWRSEHPLQKEKLANLAAELSLMDQHLRDTDWTADAPWDRLAIWADNQLSEDAQELLLSLMLEPYPDLVDGLTECMADSVETEFSVDGSVPLHRMRALIENSFDWALSIDWDEKATCARAWYVSEEKLEPRLGERFDEPIADYEQALAPARDAAATFKALVQWPDEETTATFLAVHPEHRHTIRRAQLSAFAPYSEIRDNTISAEVMPIDMLRAKLSFFGAIHFDPRSDRWVRICMYSGAPYPDELTAANSDYWIYPEAQV